jgi:hypothetical protein
LPHFLPLFSVHFRRFLFDAIRALLHDCCMEQKSSDAGWSITALLAEVPHGLLATPCMPPSPRPPNRPPSVQALALRSEVASAFWQMRINFPELSTKEICYRIQDTYGVRRAYIFEVTSDGREEA